MVAYIVLEVVVYERFQLQGFEQKNSYNGFILWEVIVY